MSTDKALWYDEVLYNISEIEKGGCWQTTQA